jgi:electron transfer flavoprotein alpha subunit
MTILIIAEHDNQDLQASTLSTITAAYQLNQPIHLLIAGHHCMPAAEKASCIPGIQSIFLADHLSYEHRLVEAIVPLILYCQKEIDYDYFLIPATSFGKNILPYLSGKLGISPVSDIIAIIDTHTYKRPIYAGNAIATIRVESQQQAISVRPTAFEPVMIVEKSKNNALIQKIDFIVENTHSRLIQLKQQTKDRPSLSSAQIVISGGRGLENQDNFESLVKIAARLGAAIGASRAAVDAGLAPNECQVGQTGQVVAPELYIAVGISGAIQHLAGMSESKIIVAINKDPEAAIFQIADYSLVADFKEVLPVWESVLSEMGY